MGRMGRMGVSAIGDENNVNPAVSSIRDKLTCVEDLLLKSNTNKKLEEDQRFQNVHLAIVDLSQKLMLEVERRRDSSDHLKKTTEYAANAMLEMLQSKFAARLNVITERLEALINRCAILEASVNATTHKLHTAFDFKMLEQDVLALSRDIEHDIETKTNKDTDFSSRVMELDYKLKAKTQDANSLCSENIRELKNQVTALSDMILHDSEPFRCEIAQELENMKRVLELTTRIRVESDSEILRTVDQMMALLPNMPTQASA